MNSKVVIFSIFCFVILIISGYLVYSDFRPDSTAISYENREYRSEKYGFTFEYPNIYNPKNGMDLKTGENKEEIISLSRYEEDVFTNGINILVSKEEGYILRDQSTASIFLYNKKEKKLYEEDFEDILITSEELVGFDEIYLYTTKDDSCVKEIAVIPHPYSDDIIEIHNITCFKKDRKNNYVSPLFAMGITDIVLSLEFNQNNWEEYENEEYGFNIKHPSNYEISTTSDGFIFICGDCDKDLRLYLEERYDEEDYVAGSCLKTSDIYVCIKEEEGHLMFNHRDNGWRFSWQISDGTYPYVYNEIINTLQLAMRDKVSLGEEFRAEKEEKVDILGIDANITITGFINQPCPDDVECVWSGQAVNYDFIYNDKKCLNDCPYDVSITESDYESFTNFIINKKDE